MAKPAKAERPQDKPPAPAVEPVPPKEPAPAAEASPSFWRALVPRTLIDSTPGEWLLKLPARKRHMLLIAVFAAIVFIPYLGAVGFWDPWEPEYNEAAREMIVRHDFIHPHYYSDSFFSKPIFSFWLMDLGQLLAGVNSPARGISVYTEWCVRTIFALVAIAGVLMLYLATARTIGKRVAVWAAVIVTTCPFYFLLARQTMVDMPFVAINTAAIGCLMIAVFEKEYVQDGWLYTFYALAGVACLTKGLLGIALPGGAMLLYLILSGDWYLLKRLRLFTGPLLTLLVMGPWYYAMYRYDGLDYEDQTSWFVRFIIHDHFQRLGYDPESHEFIAGVHTTTPNTTFVYYLEQLGYGLFPWVALVPATIASFLAAPKITRARTRREKAILFTALWVIFTFLFFAFAATKFHHYAFPAVPPLAILFGVYIEKVLDEGVSSHALPLFLGLVFYGLVAQNLAETPKHLTDLFVYKYDRTYPVREVDQAVVLALGHWRITDQDIFAFLFAIAPIVALLGVPEIRRWLAAPDGSWLAEVQAGLRKRGANLRATVLSLPRFLARGFAWIMRLLGVEKPVSEEPSDRMFVVGSLAILAFAFAIYCSSFHWRALSEHWTQRDLYWEYLQDSKPDEPMGAYMMNWKGETFYSRNTERQIKDNGTLRDFLAGPGPRKWLLVERERVPEMRNVIGPGYNVQVVDRTNVKYSLVVVSPASGEMTP